MRRIIHKSILVCVLTGALVCCGILPVLAEKTTEQKLTEAGDAIDRLQDKTEEAKKKLDAAKKEQGAIGAQLDELNARLEEVHLALEEIEAQIIKKNDQIAATEDELEQMEEKRIERYEAMKVRIRFMYENSDGTMLESMLGAHSMSEFLNRVEYFAQVVAYDRAQLTEYHSLLTGLEEKQQLYRGQKEELLALQQEQKRQQEQLTTLVADTRENLKAAQSETADAQGTMNDLEAKLQQQKEYQSVLEAQLAYEAELEAKKAAEDRARMEEIKRQEEELRRKREEEARRRAEEEERRRKEAEENGEDPGEDSGETDDPEIPASAEDLELMACIIQCEAEGEPYEGKLAVGSVVLNRVASSSFPNTIMGVIYQNGQFSPVASGRMAARLAAGANSECYQAAREVLSGNITVPYLYFRRDNGTIDGYVIAHHVFY